MINHKYNVISDKEKEIVSVPESLLTELVQLPEQVTLDSNYRIVGLGKSIPGASGQTGQTNPVTVRTPHSQAKSETTASTTTNKPVLLAPAQVASGKDEKKKHK